MSSQHIQKNFPGLLHTPAKYEKNPPYGCEAIAKKNANPAESLLSYTNMCAHKNIYIKYFLDFLKIHFESCFFHFVSRGSTLFNVNQSGRGLLLS